MFKHARELDRQYNRTFFGFDQHQENSLGILWSQQNESFSSIIEMFLDKAPVTFFVFIILLQWPNLQEDYFNTQEACSVSIRGRLLNTRIRHIHSLIFVLNGIRFLCNFVKKTVRWEIGKGVLQYNKIINETKVCQ